VKAARSMKVVKRELVCSSSEFGVLNWPRRTKAGSIASPPYSTKASVTETSLSSKSTSRMYSKSRQALPSTPMRAARSSVARVS
jgi:hypothetical protein